jgi:hypothetical protein
VKRLVVVYVNFCQEPACDFRYFCAVMAMADELGVPSAVPGMVSEVRRWGNRSRVRLRTGRTIHITKS